MMEPNLAFYRTVYEENGQEQKIPVPFGCTCGLPANYGYDGVWRCTFCSQKFLKEQTNDA